MDENYSKFNIKHTRGKVRIVPFDIKFRDDWRYINQQWIEKLFVMEELDIIQLNNPEKFILNTGGEIYFALLNDLPVGAIALKLHEGKRFELSKMGVLPKAQGHGIGKLLVAKVLEQFALRGGEELFLETNSSLTPAITLYKKMGFKKTEPPQNTPYNRADYFMKLAIN
ncbi:MAG: GNAT family N-acetyltransferase [Kordiimonadaceae bacterium]|jgi:ribosomal protein S18 acetylase RimI-like enzyme|nr:GNAT family N-acetyltransferase [Kordiimonadaceae bacterium]MDB4219433.1 GNAT family N-acetyltransferase [Emcibacteraceae bacterium]MBT6466554.1 GNAT family N-acetyltransferase [Kordiimonadaceae bacterium]MBT7544847.1 GNAT family N-acetyltransferase [Kordiimonadaceae bacterium]MBT7604577.1 GNAT family N-acetyltransferase [Kordiimonadaceae bacterium]|tara:strand:- start:2222 stop:2728 length:507 start_codon:yes stop_codon:yes gene_type:complete